jgi:hypothetical protein
LLARRVHKAFATTRAAQLDIGASGHHHGMHSALPWLKKR